MQMLCLQGLPACDVGFFVVSDSRLTDHVSKHIVSTNHQTNTKILFLKLIQNQEFNDNYVAEQFVKVFDACDQSGGLILCILTANPLPQVNFWSGLCVGTKRDLSTPH